MSAGTVPCFACGRVEGKKTKEHVWGSWLEKHVPSRPGHMFVSGERGSADAPVPPNPNVPLDVDWRDVPIGTYEHVVGGLCLPCHETLTARVENPVQPVLGPLLEGDSGRITYGSMRKIGAWAWKTGAMLNRLERPSAHAVAVEEFQCLLNDRKPPPSSLVYAGGWRGSDPNWSVTLSSAQVMTGQPVPPQPNTYLAAFAIGKMFFVVWGTTAPHIPMIALEAVDEGHMVQLWPAGPGQRVEWPPEPGVDDAVAADLKRSLGDVMPNLRREVADREALLEGSPLRAIGGARRADASDATTGIK